MHGGLKINQKKWQILSFLYQKWIMAHNLVAKSDAVSVYFRQCMVQRLGQNAKALIILSVVVETSAASSNAQKICRIFDAN